MAYSNGIQQNTCPVICFGEQLTWRLDVSRSVGDDLADENGDIGVQSDADDDPNYLEEDEEDADLSSDPETPSPPPKNKVR